MQDKVVMITGATSGIGAAAVQLFAEHGCKVVACGRRQDRGEAVVAPLGENGLFVQADMGIEADIKQTVDAAMERFGRLDFGVNNAGFGGGGLPHDTSEEDWQAVLDVNLTGVFHCMKYQAQAMMACKANEDGAAIVNVASTMGHRASLIANSVAYAATKHGVVGLTKQAGIGYCKMGIRVNGVSPGATDTELLEPLKAMGPEMIDRLNAVNPIGRMATSREVAEAIFWLCSPASAMVVGHMLPVDGGVLAVQVG